MPKKPGESYLWTIGCPHPEGGRQAQQLQLGAETLKHIGFQLSCLRCWLAAPGFQFCPSQRDIWGSRAKLEHSLSISEQVLCLH